MQAHLVERLLEDGKLPVVEALEKQLRHAPEMDGHRLCEPSHAGFRDGDIDAAAVCIGTRPSNQPFLNKAVDYANSRVVFGRSIGKNQGVQFPLARAYAELEAADMMCRRAAALFDANVPCGADANMAKLLASEATWHAAEATFATYGGFAFAREYDIERKWREVRLYQTAPISTNLILAYIGQHVLGMPRSY